MFYFEMPLLTFETKAIRFLKADLWFVKLLRFLYQNECERKYWVTSHCAKPKPYNKQIIK